MPYDSTEDTKTHISKVRDLLAEIVKRFIERGMLHDKSKLEEPEKSLYDKFTPRLRSTPYGSERYTQYLGEMGAALAHHYENNSHQPEHYPNGVEGMSLLDVLEMLADWKAASQRHADGSIEQSLEINRERFKISDQLFEILKNTVKEMEW